MIEDENMIKVFTGTEIEVNILKNRFAEIGINGIVQNDFQSGIIAGFGGGTPSSVDFYIDKKDLSEAEEIIADFNQDN